jgi:N6-L-threonylcarbamoyladenine synthase
MRILSIETSCDETAVSLVEATGGLDAPVFEVLGNALFSQIEIHREFGGVFPMLAKREHGKNLVPLLEQVLKQAEEFRQKNVQYGTEIWQELEGIVSREEGLLESMKKVLENIEKPKIDVIVVTSGPGLAPALWVGISFAQALGKLWDVPVVGVNHMEGHITSVLINGTDESMNGKIDFPALALLISGGHTELVEIENWGKYKVIGQTVDDAVGEAFDKVARMLGLPYPGGPEISKLAERARTEAEKIPNKAKLPRPMIHSNNLNFSFSGLKTAVLYYIRANFQGEVSKMSDTEKADLAREFEDSVVDVLRYKTKEALMQTGAKTLIVAGGVIANKKLKETFLDLKLEFGDLIVKIPTIEMATDNSLMIATAGYINIILNPEILNENKKIVANGNLKL